jgi:hypothetical protein
LDHELRAKLRCDPAADELTTTLRRHLSHISDIHEGGDVWYEAELTLPGESIQGTFREHSGNIQETFREHSGNIQGTFREHSVTSTRAGAFGTRPN